MAGFIELSNALMQYCEKVNVTISKRFYHLTGLSNSKGDTLKEETSGCGLFLIILSLT